MGRRQKIDWGDETFEDIDEVVAERHGVYPSTVRTERMRRGITHSNGLRRGKPQKIITTRLDREAEIYEKLAGLLEEAKTIRRLCDSAGVSLPAPLARLFAEGAFAEVKSDAVDVVDDDDEPKCFVDLEREIFERALQRNSGSQRRAAVELGVPKSTFSEKVKCYNIVYRKQSAAPEVSALKLATVDDKSKHQAAKIFAVSEFVPNQSKQHGQHGQCYVCERPTPILATGFAANVCQDHASPATLKNWASAEHYWGRSTVFPALDASTKKIKFGPLTRYKRGRPSKKQLAEFKEESSSTAEETLSAPKIQPAALSDTVAKKIDWFWRDRIPAGMVTVLYGPPGLGKGTLTATLAAAATMGRSLPMDAQSREPGRVLFVVSEDSPALTLRPRLDAAGADVSKIDFFGPELGLRLPANFSDIESAITPETRLVVIDPLRGHVASDRGRLIREVLVGLEAMAARTKATILVVHHSSKADEMKPLGGQDIVGIPRSVLVVSQRGDGERAMLQFKKNLAPDAEPVTFRIGNCNGVGVVLFGESRAAHEAEPEVPDAPVKLIALPLAAPPRLPSPKNRRAPSPPRRGEAADGDEESESDDDPDSVLLTPAEILTEDDKDLESEEIPLAAGKPILSYSGEDEEVKVRKVKRTSQENREWQRDLAARAKSGDKVAAGQLVMSVDMMTTSLCRKIAMAKTRGQAKEEDVEDMCATAKIVLLEHIEDYNPDFAWTTYATWWIKQAAFRWWQDHSRTIRIPVHIYDKQTSAMQAKIRFVEEHGREPSDEEWCAAANISSKSLYGLKALWARSKSLDAPISSEEGEESVTIGDYLADSSPSVEELLVRNVESARIREALGLLSEQHRFVLERRFGLTGEKMTMDDVAAALYAAGLTRWAISRQRTEQIEKDAKAEFAIIWRRLRK